GSKRIWRHILQLPRARCTVHALSGITRDELGGLRPSCRAIAPPLPRSPQIGCYGSPFARIALAFALAHHHINYQIEFAVRLAVKWLIPIGECQMIGEDPDVLCFRYEIIVHVVLRLD